MTEPILDGAHLDELEAELSPADVVTLLNLFLETTPGLVDAVLEAAAIGDEQAVTRAAHRLKGGALSIGATAMAAVAQELESSGSYAAGRTERLSESWQETATALRQRIALRR